MARSMYRMEPGLSFKTRQPVPVLRKAFRQNLNGNLSAQLRVRGPIHLTHDAGAEKANDFELPKLCP